MNANVAPYKSAIVQEVNHVNSERVISVAQKWSKKKNQYSCRFNALPKKDKVSDLLLIIMEHLAAESRKKIGFAFIRRKKTPNECKCSVVWSHTHKKKSVDRALSLSDFRNKSFCHKENETLRHKPHILSVYRKHTCTVSLVHIIKSLLDESLKN